MTSKFASHLVTSHISGQGNRIGPNCLSVCLGFLELRCETTAMVPLGAGGGTTKAFSVQKFLDNLLDQEFYTSILYHIHLFAHTCPARNG